MTVSESEIRADFFEYLFGKEVGYICIAAAKPRNRTSFHQTFYKWPQQRKAMLQSIASMTKSHNIWFCINLLKKDERKKEYCLPTNLIWADLDTCKPERIVPEPQCVIESSPGRYQGIWRLDDTLDPFVAEAFSKRIAYTYSDNGSDKSGWDLTQLLRVPFTYNYKYGDVEGHEAPPKVELLAIADPLVSIDLFTELDDVEDDSHLTPDLDLPDTSGLTIENILYKHQLELQRTPFNELFTTEPDESDDWSRIMWRLINVCLEAGMSMEETFVIAQSAPCNKYERDGRVTTHLWREIIKAEGQQHRITILTGGFKPIAMPQLVEDSELKKVKPTFVDNYVEWATEATDAIPEYHELSAFMLLSSIMASGLALETSYGTMHTNLWGLILGDSTLTRKTTAMKMAMDIIAELERDMVLATDGSAEGLLTGLSTRPNRTSIYFKDEVSGFMDAIKRKDYLAGMLETLTQLYDVPQIYTRRLRKETISLSSPVFIFYGGGIRDKMYSLLTDEHILSGFLPRFLIVSGDADISKIRTTGPRSASISEKRSKVISTSRALFEEYTRESVMEIAGQEMSLPVKIEAVLTDDAWSRYGAYELLMVTEASTGPISAYALPTFERLSRSLLKMSCLLAGSRQKPVDNEIEVTETDVKIAAKYIQRWGRHTIDMVQNIGRGTTQRTMDKIMGAIKRSPGVTRSELMQAYHLTSREANELFGSLEDRGQIRKEKAGRGHRYYPTV